MKIGICTPYKINNYGTKLQAYAVQEKIKSMGYDVEIINFDRRSDLRISRLYRRYCNREFFSAKMRSFRNRKQARINPEYAADLLIRKDAINSFDRTHLKTTKTIKGYRNLCKNAKEYSAFVCGSDQIWLPSTINNPTTTLEFVPPNCRRIAFAPSFGISKIPTRKEKQYRSFLNKFDYLSVREDIGVSLVDQLIHKHAQLVLDPTLAVPPTLWNTIKDEGHKLVDGNYVFCYFLGKNEDHRLAVKELAQEHNLKVVTLAHFKGYVQADELYSDIQLYNVSPCDFVRLISEANFVCTDSFHATIFSIIFHREFFTFERFNNSDVNSANSRIYSLLNQLNISDRLVRNVTSIHPNSTIDYSKVDDLLSSLRAKTDLFLGTAFKDLSPSAPSLPCFTNPDDTDCCGCSACVEVCPQKCISMKTDPETGFHYPELTNTDSCINCGRCNLVCPQKRQLNVSHAIQDAYYISNNNMDVRRLSSSGGVFYSVAHAILTEGGFVCGAAFDKDFNVHHKIISSTNDLPDLIGSKYSESCLDGIFTEIKKILLSGKKLLFCGTPCQVHGLKCFLSKDYKNLFTLDLLCYGIQSPKAWKKYLEDRQKICGIAHINMRSKVDSWQNYSMEITFQDGSTYLSSKKHDPYLRSYSKGLFIRPSCYSCMLKAFPRKSDFTVGDFWDIDKISPELNDGNGAGIIMFHSEKGRSLFESIAQEFNLQKIDSAKLKVVHPLFCLNARKNKKSQKFFDYLEKSTFTSALSHCEQSRFEKTLRLHFRKMRASIRRKLQR